MIRESFLSAEKPATQLEAGLPRIRRERRKALLLGLAVLLGGILLTFAASQAFRRIEWRESETAFEHGTDRYLNAFRQDLRAKEKLLRGAAGFFAASELVTAKEWSRYVGLLNIEPTVSGILAMGYSQRVAPALRNSFEASMRAGGYPDFVISPAGERADLQSITHLAPDDGVNRKALGTDMLADPALRPTIELAQDTGDLVITPNVSRLGTSNDDQQAVLMILPVFLDSMPKETPAQRAQAFIGFVFLEMRVDGFARSALDGLNAGQHVRILDTSSKPARELFDSNDGSPTQSDSIVASRTLEVFGRLWILRVSDYARRETVVPASVIVSVSGFVASLLLALLIWHLGTTRARAELLARRITRDLRQAQTGLLQSQALLSSVIHGLPSGILLTDDSLQIRLANRAFCEQVRCHEADVIGRRIADLIEPDLALHLKSADLAAPDSNGEPVAELVLNSAVGEPRIYQVRKVSLAGEHPLVLSIYTDITELRAQSRLIRALIDHLPQRFLIKDRDSRFLLTNSKLAADVGLQPEDMRGRCDADFFAPEIAARYRAHDLRVMESGEPCTVEEPYLRGWLRTTKAPLRDLTGSVIGVVGILDDITERREMELEVRRSRDMLDAINRLQDDFMNDPDSNAVFEDLLGRLLDNANCELGMLGEALVDPDLSRYMRALAVGKIVVDSETGTSHRVYTPQFMDLRDPATLFGSVLVTNQPVISNDVANDPRAQKPSPGHPALENFAGLPIRSGDDLIGMVGLGNRSGGFDAALLAQLEPLLGTFGKLLLARRSETARKQAEAELARHRDHLQELVDEQTSEARAARDQAQRANRVKSEFLANMSHELRTPMHAILSFAKLGETRAKADSQSKLNGYFERIRVSGDRLLMLLNDLLDLSKLEAGRMDLDLQPHAVDRLVREIACEFEGMFQAKGVQLRLHDVLPLAHIPLDSGRIAQVLRNLLSNAIKFTPHGRAVELRVMACDMPPGRRRDDHRRLRRGVEVVVSDEGVGIPESELDRVFDKFVQSSRTQTGAGGTGLGLAISREIVASHRGEIFARHNSKGGTDFVLRLPSASANPVNPILVK